MAYQSQFNAFISHKVQSALGIQAAGGAGANIIRTAGGPGGRLTKATTESNEVRQDGQRSRGRHGTQKASGSYTTQLSIDEGEEILEAVTRGTYSVADLVITEATASLTSITTTTSTIVAGAGSWITAGVRVGEVWRLTNHSTAGNNNLNLVITGVTATTLTVGGTPLTLNATPDTAFTLTRPGRKLILPDAGALVPRYFTIEEYEIDIDSSEIFTDAVWGMVKYSMAPNGIVMVDRSWVGTGKFQTNTAGSAPFFTSPTLTTGVPLSVADASLYVNGVPVVDLTSFDVTLDLKPQSPDTFGSPAARYAPDVFTGQAAVSLNFGMLRKDITAVTDFNAETQYSLIALMVENEAEPKDFNLIYIPNFTLGGVDKSALSKDGGPRTQTIQVPEGLVGKDDSGGAFDSTMIKFQVSTAT